MALDPKEIGRRIAAAREAKGWTQLVFATEIAHVSPSTVARWEAGNLPAVRELIRVAGLLDVSADSLVELGVTNGDRVEALSVAVEEVRLGMARIERLLRERLALPPDAAASG